MASSEQCTTIYAVSQEVDLEWDLVDATKVTTVDNAGVTPQRLLFFCPSDANLRHKT